MRYTRFLCVLLAAAFTLSLMAKKPKDKNKYGVYLVGVSASFSDSLVYFTDVQFVDSASIDKKGLLTGRARYSEQLSEFMDKQGKPRRTCFIFFDEKQKSLLKDVNKLKHKYNKEGGVSIQNVDSSFKFTKAAN